MGILAVVEGAIAEVEAVVAGLDAATLTGPDAAALTAVFVRGERLCGAGKTLVAGRAADTSVWRQAGDRSAAHWLARQSGTTVGSAAATLDTAARMDLLPGTDRAFRSGRLSELQAREITSAAASRPQAEDRLLQVAQHDSVQGLRDACRAVTAGGGTDEAARMAAIHRGRYFKHWLDPDGAGRLDARMTPDALAVVVAEVEARTGAIFDQARAEGRREPYHAYQADALVAMARAAQTDGGAGSGPAVAARVLVDHAALIRGWAEPGETCEIAGVGPVPVATATAMMADAFLAAVVTDGVDVYTVAHLGRTVTAHQRTALEVRDRECVVPGCHQTGHLEIDHVDGWAQTGITKLDRLARLCHFHHAQKTYDGYRLEGTPGQWSWTPPQCTQVQPTHQPAERSQPKPDATVAEGPSTPGHGRDGLAGAAGVGGMNIPAGDRPAAHPSASAQAQLRMPDP